MTIRIMVSGSRDYDDYEFIRSTIEDVAGTHREVVIIHGAARGADSLANEVAEEYGFTIESYPADWSLGTKGGSVRNAEMLIKDIDIALFFLHPTSANVGTRDAIKKALLMGVDSRYFLGVQEYSLSELKRSVRPF